MIGLVLGLILVGVILLLIEFLVVPGTTVIGFLGMILMGLGVYLSYTEINTETGHYTLAGSVLLFIIALVLALRSQTWKRASLNTSIESKVSVLTVEQKDLIGKNAFTISRLNPTGKIDLNGEYYEAKSIFSIIEPKTEVEIVAVEGNTLIVKPKK